MLKVIALRGITGLTETGILGGRQQGI